MSIEYWVILGLLVVGATVVLSILFYRPENAEDLVEGLAGNGGTQPGYDNIQIRAANGSRVKANRGGTPAPAGGTGSTSAPGGAYPLAWVWINGVALPAGGATPGLPTPIPVPPTPPVAPAAPTFSQPGGVGTPVIIAGTGDCYIQYAVVGAAYSTVAIFVPGGSLSLAVPGDVAVGTQLRARAAGVGPTGPGPWSADSAPYTVV